MARIATKSDELLARAIAWIKQRGFATIKTNLVEGYESPSSFTNINSESSVTPDLTAVNNNKKHYFEIALKTPEVSTLVSKWKLLNRLSKIKQSNFYLFVPDGHWSFTKRLVEEHGIDAQLIKLKK